MELNAQHVTLYKYDRSGNNIRDLNISMYIMCRSVFVLYIINDFHLVADELTISYSKVIHT